MASFELPCDDPNPISAGLYQTDPWNRSPLFVVNERIVRSWREAHALLGRPTLEDVNPDFVRAIITQDFNSDISPYKNITRIPRFHYLLNSQSGHYRIYPYEPFKQGAPRMEESQLYDFIREKIHSSLLSSIENSNSNIACEHSSGLDSNAIMGSLLLGLGISADRIHTVTWTGTVDDDYMPKIRHHFQLQEKQCHEVDVDTSTTDSSFNEIASRFNENLKVYGCPPQMGIYTDDSRILQRKNCALLFSGFGGDQALSHHGINVGTDIASLRQWKLFYSWYGSKSFPLKHFLSRSLAKRSAKWAKSKNKLTNAPKGRFDNLLVKTLTAAGLEWFNSDFELSYNWEFDGFSPQRTAIRNRVLSNYVSVRVEDESRSAQYFGIRKTFPLLDETLIATLLNQDPLLFCPSFKKSDYRSMIKNTFGEYYPSFFDELVHKTRIPPGGYEAFMQKECARLMHSIQLLAPELDNLHPLICRLWCIDDLKIQVNRLMEGDVLPVRSMLDDTRAVFESLYYLSEVSNWFNCLSDS